jgi:ATP-dependent DNA ligase
VNLPVNPPVLPMLAKRVAELPSGDDWIFEPKWDGFRALVFRDGDEILIQSRDEKPLNRYFPELIAPLLSALPSQCVLDGEIVIAHNNGLDFPRAGRASNPCLRGWLLQSISPRRRPIGRWLRTGFGALRVRVSMA